MMKSKEKGLADEKGMTRRRVLKVACCATAAASVVALSDRADAAISDVKTYPQVRIANLKDMPPGKTKEFDYPLIGRKNILINVGCSVEGGIGPNRGIVAYSKFCTHLGCSLEFNKDNGMLVCECHQGTYDPKQSGKVVEGPPPNNLPMINLEIDNKTGDIYAVGVAGLIYGMRNNLLDGEVVR
ncbi:MAG: arsenate reductase (azurin) small subunit [Thermodesulfovibrionia bacterium]